MITSMSDSKSQPPSGPVEMTPPPPSYYQDQPSIQMPAPKIPDPQQMPQFQTSQPPNHYPPQGANKPPAQIGEEYRAALFARCAQGLHEPRTSYGICGIITGVLLFPIGLICLFIDTEKKCDRCGVSLP